jgi:glutaredoxin
VSGPEIELHLLTLSHPCLTAKAALDRKGLAYEEVVMPMGEHQDEIERIYGEGRRTVPGMTIDGEAVHGSTAIQARLEELFPDPLDPAGVDFVIPTIRSSWKYHSITAERTASDLAALPGMVEQIEEFAREGLIGGEEPTAADFQIGATARILLTIGDLAPVFDGTAAREVALRHFPDYPGEVPAGAWPAGWVRPR